MHTHESLERVFEGTLISIVSEDEESTITGGFFGILNFDYSADYKATSGISTPKAFTFSQVDVFATGRGSARLYHTTQGYVRY